MLEFEHFAQKYCLRTRRDTCGDETIPGREGHISEYGRGRLLVVYVGMSGRRWGNVRRSLMAAGCSLAQDGDSQGSLVFDPRNGEQAQKAIEAIGAKRKRQMTPAQRDALAKARSASPVPRQNAARPCAEGGFRA